MKKGDKVILHLFTGLATKVTEIVAASKTTVTIHDNKGNELVFDKKTLKQIEPAPKKPCYANYITEDDGSFVPKPRGKSKKKKELSQARAEAVKPKKKAVENWDDEDFDEDEFIEI
jgi:hypothetical protein